jgi:hypothetical protein
MIIISVIILLVTPTAAGEVLGSHCLVYGCKGFRLLQVFIRLLLLLKERAVQTTHVVVIIKEEWRVENLFLKEAPSMSP